MEHHGFHIFTLLDFDHNMTTFVVPIGDILYSGRAFSRTVELFYVGCYSHHFNLAIENILEE